MHFFTPSKKVGPNLKPYYERFLSEFYENGKQNLQVQQMTEQIAAEVDTKINLWKNCKKF